LVAPEAELQPAYAGIDRTVCSDTAHLQAIVLNNNVKGTWSVINKNTVLDTPNEDFTIAAHLEGGENKFIWTVSKGRCKAYSKDTLALRRIIQPLVTADIFDLKPSLNTITGDVLNNDLFLDDITTNTDLQFKWLHLPAEGQFKAGEANGKFQYTLPLGLLKDVDWLYSICHPACIATCDSVKVTINNENTNIIAANTITPNGDGANDAFIVDELLTNPAAYPNNEIVILNRWGEVVFEAKPYNNDWDGSNKHRQPLPQGTYYYILRLDNNRGIILKGDITVLR
jgi:gliding motility-associated-like protein